MILYGNLIWTYNDVISIQIYQDDNYKNYLKKQRGTFCIKRVFYKKYLYIQMSQRWHILREMFQGMYVIINKEWFRGTLSVFVEAKKFTFLLILSNWTVTRVSTVYRLHQGGSVVRGGKSWYLSNWLNNLL